MIFQRATRNIAGLAFALIELASLGTVCTFSRCVAQEKTPESSKELTELIVGLRSPRVSVAHESAQTLAEMGGRAQLAVPGLIEAAKTRRAIRSVTIYAIGRIAETLGKKFGKEEAETALPVLTDALNDADGKIREVAAYAIGRLAAALDGTSETRETQNALSALIGSVSDPKPKIQRAAAEALGLFRQYDVISDHPEKPVQALIHALRNSNKQSGADVEQVQIDSSAALGKFGFAAAAAVPDLVVALQSGNLLVQRAAAFALAEIGSRAAAVPLQAALMESDTEVQKAAAFALGRIDAPAADMVPALVAALRDRNKDVRDAVAGALGSYGSDREAFPALIGAVSDRDPEVRTATANVLGMLAENSASADTAQLIPQLERARGALAAALSSIGRDDISRRSLTDALAKIQRALDEKQPKFPVVLWRRHKAAVFGLMVVIGCCLWLLSRIARSAQSHPSGRRLYDRWIQFARIDGPMNRLRGWYNRIYQDAFEWRPGYWGGVPYLLVLRCSVAAGIWLRFQLHSRHLLPSWTDWALIIAIVFAFVLHWRPKATYSRRTYAVLVALDVLVISTAYWNTHNRESDFFLFYYLPIFTAAEFLGSRWVIAAFTVASLAFGYVVFDMPTEAVYRGGTTFQVFARVFLPREVFYFAISLIWALRLRRERDSRQRSITRQHQMKKLLDCKREIDTTFAVREVLRAIVVHAKVDLQARCAVGVLSLEGKDGHLERVIQWADDSARDAKTLDLCEKALAAESPNGAVPIVVLGRWIGALAVDGLDASQRANSDEYLRSLAELVAIAHERARLFEALREIGGAAATAVELNQGLESMLDTLVDKLGFEYAIISLVDSYKDRIRTVRGRNVPPGWVASSSHSLASNDILASIAKTRKTEVFDAYDSRFNYSIWQRYGHKRFARVFTPIVDPEREQDLAIGVIEAGCLKERRQIVDKNFAEVTRLGREFGPSIARSLPQVLLELIATRALELIGADSASLHVFRTGREFLVAGAGRANKHFLQKHPPRENGIGREAMRTRQRVVENHLPEAKSALRSEGIHAMAAFPLNLAEDVSGVLYFHYWRPHQFSDPELELASVFVPQMEVAIQNSLLLQDFSRIDEKAWMITGLRNVIGSLGSNLKIDPLLQRLADDALYILDPKNVTLYQYKQQNREFSPAVTAGRFEKLEAMKTEVRADDIVTKVVEEGRSRFISNTDAAPFLRQARKDDIPQPRFVEREGIKSCAILVLKLPNDGEIVGCLFANYDELQDFESPGRAGLVKLAYSLASSAAVAIKAARLHQQDLEKTSIDIERRESEIEALRVIDRMIVGRAAELRTREMCEIVLDQALRVLGRQGDVTLGDVTTWNPTKKRLEVVAERGFPEGWVDSNFQLGDGVVGWVARELKPELIGDVSLDSRYRKINEDTRAELAVPILDVAADENVLLGVINVEHRSVNAFSERDKAFLETLAVQMTIAVHTMDLYAKLLRQLQRVLSLSKVAGRIQDSNLQLEVILRLILTGVTAGAGLGFSRAILFELSDDMAELRGSIGIGKLAREPAEAVWERIEEASLDALLDLAARQNGHRGETGDMMSGDFVQKLRIPLQTLAAPIHDSLHLNAVGVHSLAARELDGTGLQGLYDNAPDCAIAWIPLKGTEKAVGALLVDNRFSAGESKLDLTLDSILVAFAELAAMSIEGARLRARLADEKQLSNWREASARAAHALEERILNIENGLKEVRMDLEKRNLRTARAKLDELEKSIQDVNSRLYRIKIFGAQRSQMVMSRVDMVAVMRHIVKTRERNLRCVIEIDANREAMYVKADQSVLPDMFADLLANADRAMGGKPGATIRIRMRPDLEDQRVTIDIEDNGPGIRSNILDKVFEPYVTTSGRTGLGLPEIKRLVEDHGGDISCGAAADGSGARFTIRLLLEEAPITA